jgi:hypothetical protein
MKTRIIRVSRVVLALSLTTSAATVSAGWFGQRGDCARSAYGPCARQDYTRALQHARRLDGLDCAELAGYAECVRATMNGQIWSSIRQPLVGPGAASSTAPLPSIEAPFTSPPTLPADPSPPVFTPETPKAEAPK